MRIRFCLLIIGLYQHKLPTLRLCRNRCEICNCPNQNFRNRKCINYKIDPWNWFADNRWVMERERERRPHNSQLLPVPRTSAPRTHTTTENSRLTFRLIYYHTLSYCVENQISFKAYLSGRVINWILTGPELIYIV